MSAMLGYVLGLHRRLKRMLQLNGRLCQFGVLVVGVLATKALLFWVSTGAPEFLETPKRGIQHSRTRIPNTTGGLVLRGHAAKYSALRTLYGACKPNLGRCYGS